MGDKVTNLEKLAVDQLLAGFDEESQGSNNQVLTWVDGAITWADATVSLGQGNLTEDTSTSNILTITGGDSAVVGSGTTIAVAQADSATDGYLSSTDWNTFNTKQAALTQGDLTETTSSILTISGGDSAVIGSGVTIEVTEAGSATAGYLSASNFNTFNAKQDALTQGNLTETTSSILTITGGDSAVIGAGVTIEVVQSDSATSGYLSNTDWNTFNDKQAALSGLTDNRLIKADGTTAIQSSGITVADNDDVSGIADLIITERFANGGSVGSNAMLKLNGNTLTGVNQYAIEAGTFTGNSSATNAIIGGFFAPTTGDFTSTTANVAGIRYQNISKGTGSTITRRLAARLDTPTGGENNATIADNLTFTGDFFIHSTNSNPSLFTGGIRNAYSEDNVTNPPTDAELDSAFGTPSALGSGWTGILNDNGGGTNEYLCWTDGTNWFYVTGTLAS